MKLHGKTILITGGTAGIGLEAAKQFLALGAKVIVTGRDQVKLDKTKKMYPAVITIKSDAANANDVGSLFDQVKELGGIDILYNNAGVVGGTPLSLGVANPKHFENAEMEININYLGVIRLNNLFMEMLQSRKEAAIINTASILSYVPSYIAPTYSASKAAMRSYTDSLREHLKMMGSKVQVFELSPPLVATDLAESFEGKGMKPEKLVEALIQGLQKDDLRIRVGDTKIVYFMSRFFPKFTYSLVNPLKNRKFS